MRVAALALNVSVLRAKKIEHVGLMGVGVCLVNIPSVMKKLRGLVYSGGLNSFPMLGHFGEAVRCVSAPAASHAAQQ